MSDYVLFEMREPFRQSLIKGHLFYVEQARKRLLSQFEDISAEADKAAEEWLENNSHRFDPDRHDPADFDEAAYDASIEFYSLLSDMRDQTRLSVVAGMFHEWDKRLRDWLVRQIGHWHHGSNAASKVWSVNFEDITDLLENLGWKIRSTEYIGKLGACRLVVNVFKHGEGQSLRDLKQNHPEYLADPFGGVNVRFSQANYRDYKHLNVNEDQFQAFSNAIVAFWQDVPNNILYSQVNEVPDWFGKAIMKDDNGQGQSSSR